MRLTGGYNDGGSPFMSAGKKHKKLIIVLCIIGVVVVLIGLFVHRVKKQAEELLATLTAQETAEVTRRDLVSTISASGTIVSIDSRDVTSNLTGVVVESVSAAVGDTVKTGDVLCVFNEEELSEKLTAAENTRAQSSLKNSHDITADQQALDDAVAEYLRQIPNLQGAVDRAKHDWEVAATHLEEARRAYEDDSSEQNRDLLYSAETSANSAYASYVNALNEQESKTISLQEAIDTAQ